MRILCENCGSSEVVQVSPDYLPETHREFLDGVVKIRFLYDEEPIDEYFLSSNFAEENQLSGEDIELPDDYPLWTRKMKIMCRTCFDNRLND